MPGEQFAHTWQEHVSAPTAIDHSLTGADTSDFTIISGPDLIIRSESKKDAKILIYDLNGRILYSGTIFTTETEHHTYFHPDKNTLYIISIYTEEKMETFRFVSYQTE